MVFAAPLDMPEGPVALNDGSFYCVEMGPQTGCVTRISADGKIISHLGKTGRPNGLAVDRFGAIWIAESSTPSLLRMSPDGKFETWMKAYKQKYFIFPNDLAFGPDGKLYMTDSGIGTYDLAQNGQIRDDYLDLNYDGRVYQININDRKITEIDSGLLFANGIAFGPDNKLYINETITGNIYSYTIDGNRFSERFLFGNVLDPNGPSGWSGPDGMKFGQDGNLYCSVYGQKNVTVLDHEGKVIHRIETKGRLPTNLAFGYGKQSKIYITEVELGQIEVFDVNTTGFHLYS